MAEIDRVFDFSGGVQDGSIWEIRRPNELQDAENARFGTVIGAIVRRNGTATIDTIQANKDGLLLHEAKWKSNPVILFGINASDDATSVIKKRTGVGTYSNLVTGLAPDTRMQAVDHLNETYVAGMTDSGTRMTIQNIRDVSGTTTVSTTRNLYGAPKAAFITEYNGSLHAMNVEIDGVAYPDRDYYSSPPMGAVTYVRAQQSTVTDISPLAVDSVRYLKVGMAIDVYAAGTETKLYDFNITAVDKNLETITVNGTSETFATTAVNTGTDVITVTNNYATGTPIVFTSTTTVPAGLTAGTTYYAINVSSTTIKVATTAANATAGTAIDITSQGTGTHTVRRQYVFSDNDEIWLDGRKGELSVLWNTDYPTPQTADWIYTPPGVTADSAIKGWGKSNNRLMLFTERSMHKYDGANFPTVYENIGCISHRTIQNIGDWMIWLDAEGVVRARNDSTGQSENLSRFIKRSYLTGITAANLRAATAGVFNNQYKLSLGYVGSRVRRLVYDFDGNTWAPDTYPMDFTQHLATSTISGTYALYFISDKGKLMQDDIGNDDDGDSIPFRAVLGRRHHGVELVKNYHGWRIYGENVAGCSFYVAKENEDFTKEVGRLSSHISEIPVPDVKPLAARDINVKIASNAKSDPPMIEGIITYFNVQEDNFG